MRTKNAKRLWPVPATLAVMAVAAFLAFGLMATNGAQPAAAQDADCTVTISIGGGGDAVQISTAQDTDTQTTGTQIECDAAGDTATIKFTGPGDNPGELDEIDVYVLVEDKSGSLSFYANTDVWQSQNVDVTVGGDEMTRKKGTFYTADGSTATEAKPTKYFEHDIEVLRAKRQGGRFVAQSTEITVKGEGTIHVFLPDEYDTDLVADFADADCSPTCEGLDNVDPPKAQKFASGQPADDTATVLVTFLGAPMLGKDSDNDRNKVLDDFKQCVTDAADGEFDDSTTDPDGVKGDCGEEGTNDDPDEDDTTESRSKLVVMGSTEEGHKPLINGKTLTYKMDDEDEVTIHAVIEDAKGNALEDMEVIFISTTNPMGIVAERDLADEKDTEIIGDTDASSIDGVDGIDAVASYTLDGLAKVKGSYTIDVEVMVGSLSLGMVTITRPGIPATLHAGIFNKDCFEKGDEEDYSDATFDMSDDDCEAMGMMGRFGASEMVVVKAHLEDSLGNVVGESDDLDSELANEDDDLLGDADMVTIEDPVEGKDMPRAWVYAVDKKATLGAHMITVSTTAENADDEAIDDVTLTVTVAGPPHEFAVDGPDVIELGGAAEYTVTATDEIDGIPHIIDEGNDRNDLVAVAVQPVTTLVTGLNASRMLELDEDTGVGKFTVYAALDATHGSAGRIIVGPADNLTIVSISFGSNRAPHGGHGHR